MGEDLDEDRLEEYTCEDWYNCQQQRYMDGEDVLYPFSPA